MTNRIKGSLLKHYGIFSLLLAQSAYADLSYLDLKGVDEIIGDHPGLNPSMGYLQLDRSLPNRRFYGNYGPKKQGFGCLENASVIHGLLVENNDCPQDATSELIQRLFPSQDGINFVANQIPSDPVSKLDLAILGAILDRLSEIPDTPLKFEDSEKLRIDLFKLLTGKQGSSLGKSINARRKQLKATIIRGGARGKEVASYCELPSNQDMREMRKFFFELQKRAKETKTPSAVATIASRWSDAEAQDFISLIMASLKESRLPESPYPKYLPEQTLLAFFIKKANGKDDLLSLFEGMRSKVSDHGRQVLTDDDAKAAFKSSRWNKEDYRSQEWKADPNNIAARFASHPSFLTFAVMQEKFDKRALPPILSYSTASHDGHSYPDCGETSLRNFFNILTFDSETGKFDHTRLQHGGLSVADGLRQFYEVNPDPARATHTSLYDQWGAMVASKRLSVKYLKPTKPDNYPVGEPYTDTSSPQQCEIGVGVDNMMEILDHLLYSESRRGRQKGLIASALTRSEKLDALCAAMSREGRALSWSIAGKSKADSMTDLNGKDTGISVQFSIEGKPSFEWDFLPGHFAVRDLTPHAASWKNQVAGAMGTYAATPGYGASNQSLLLPFVNETTFDALANGAHSLNQRENLIYALPLSSYDGKLSGFKKVVSSQRDQVIAMKPLADRLRAKLPEETDLHTKQQIHAALADAGQPYDGETVHALGKPDAVYTRVSHDELSAKFGALAATQMGRTWRRTMHGHSVAIGEPLTNPDGTERKLKFKDAKQACLDLNEAGPKRDAVKIAFEEREAQLDVIRKDAAKTTPIKETDLIAFHTAHPILGCYLMSHEEWKILEGDFGYRDKPSRYISQILPKVSNRYFWSSSGYSRSPQYACFFDGYVGSVDANYRVSYRSVRCACGAPAW